MLRHNSPTSALDHLLQTGLDDGHFIGVGVVLIQDGQISYATGYGTTNMIEGGTPITPDTLFRSGSVSKTFCATLIMRLVERGVLELDRPVVDYLPGFTFSNMEYGRQITLRHLLSHTSGLPSGGRNFGPREKGSLKQLVWEEIPRYRFIAEPGRFHQYSNTVICLAGHVAEAVTGLDYDELIETELFKPLGMNRATYDPNMAITYPVALPHQKNEGEALSILRPMTRNQGGHPSSFAYTSTADLARLALMMINHGTIDGQAFLTPDTIQLMQTAQCDLHVRAAAHPFWQIYSGYGLGLQTGRYAGTVIARHGGTTPGYQTFFDLFPLQRAGVIMQFTYLETTPVINAVMKGWHTVLNLTKQDPFFASAPAAIRKVAPRGSKKYVGTYLNIDRGETAQLEIIGKQILLEYQGRQRPLIQTGETEFYAEISDGVRIPVFMMQEDDDDTCRDILIWGYPFHRYSEDEIVDVTPEALDKFVGLYIDRHNPNQAERIAVQKRNDRLQLVEGEEIVNYRPLNERLFIGEMGMIEFFTGDDGEISHFQLGRGTCYYKKMSNV